MANSRRAQIRIWLKDTRMRREQLKQIQAFSQELGKAVAGLDRARALFRMALLWENLGRGPHSSSNTPIKMPSSTSPLCIGTAIPIVCYSSPPSKSVLARRRLIANVLGNKSLYSVFNAPYRVILFRLT